MSKQQDINDAHTLLVEADAQLSGLRNLTVNASETTIDHLTGFEFNMLLQPANERVVKAMKLIEAV